MNIAVLDDNVRAGYFFGMSKKKHVSSSGQELCGQLVVTPREMDLSVGEDSIPARDGGSLIVGRSLGRNTCTGTDASLRVSSCALACFIHISRV
jgi:hypothetical protein